MHCGYCEGLRPRSLWVLASPVEAATAFSCSEFLVPEQQHRYPCLPQPLPFLLPQPLHDEEDVCPEVRAGFLSRLTFNWMGPLMKRGYRAPLDFADVWRLPPGDRSATLDQRFVHLWAAERQRNPQNPSLVRTGGGSTQKGLGGVGRDVTAVAG